jgi:SAM-dependent methyltransferase
LLWGNDPPAPRARDTWTRRFRRQLNPVGSRLSPLRYFSDWRVEQYYRRTLSDPLSAKSWAKHYLTGLKIDECAPVLDHGCGRGRNAAILSQLGFEVAAQDVRAHPWWRNLPACRFQQVPAAAPRLPWVDNTFALAIDVQVLHDLDESRLKTLMREMYRVLAPGGYWLLLEANTESYGAWAPRRYWGRLHTLERVQDIASRAGFDEIDHCYEGVYAPVLPGLVNFVRKQAWPGAYSIDDYGSWLETAVPESRRAFWFLRLRKHRAQAQSR